MLISGNLVVLKHFKPELSIFFNIGPKSPQNYTPKNILLLFCVQKIYGNIAVELEKLWAWLLKIWDFIIE